MIDPASRSPPVSERQTLIKRLFNAAIDLSPVERRAFLHEHCANDAELLGAIEGLLVAFDDSATLVGGAPAPGSPGVSAALPRGLASIGKYLDLAPIGQGAMGTVYRAHDPMLDRPVAIKVISTLAFQGGDEATLRRFQREARIAAGLNHPAIVTVHDFGEEAGVFYLVMEYLDGEHLGRPLRRGDFGNVEAKLEVMERICEGVAFAHAKGMVHRDIKPSNIYCLPDGRIKILDFGLARFSAAPRTTLGVTGTPQYMSPEQVRGEAVDARSDVFSLGALFYEILTHTPCFPAPTLHAVLFQVLQRQPESVRRLDPALPALADMVVSRALTKETEVRFADAGELLEGIRWLRRVVKKECTEDEAIAALGFAQPDAAPPASPAIDPPTRTTAASLTRASTANVSLANVSFVKETGGDRGLSADPAVSPTLLELALAAGIPIYHECGGHGRCSTCRVRVVRGDGLLPRNPTETRLAGRLGWQKDIRLACQARVVGDVAVQRLIHDAEDFGLLRYERRGKAPRETTLAVLACSLRNAAEVLQRSAPYDVVHMLNRFYYEVGEPILAGGGQISEYRDGGLIAYFGLDGGTATEKCLAAVQAALRAASRLQAFDVYLRNHFGFDASFGLGVHFGRTIVGHLGHPSSYFVSALGEVNHVAGWLAGCAGHGTPRVLASEEVINVIEDELRLGDVATERDVRGFDRPCFEIVDFKKPDAVLLVQSSFDAVKPRRQEAAETFYSLLFMIDPETRELFTDVDMTRQGEKLMTVLEAAVQGLDRLDELMPVLQDLGRRHAGYGVELRHYDAVEQALLEMLHQILGATFSIELRLAWSRIYGQLAAIMMDAASGLRAGAAAR